MFKAEENLLFGGDTGGYIPEDGQVESGGEGPEPDFFVGVGDVGIRALQNDEWVYSRREYTYFRDGEPFKLYLAGRCHVVVVDARIRISERAEDRLVEMRVVPKSKIPAGQGSIEFDRAVAACTLDD